MSPDCDLETISQQLPANLTGADLYSLCAEAVTNGMQREIAKIESGMNIQASLSVCLYVCTDRAHADCCCRDTNR